MPANPAADSVTVIDLKSTPPKAVGEVPVPTSVVGPPSSVAIARDESFALVTAATKVDPADMQSLQSLISDKYKGRIALYDYYLPIIGMAAMA